MAELFWEVFNSSLEEKKIHVFLCDEFLTCAYAPLELLKGKNDSVSKTRTGGNLWMR